LIDLFGFVEEFSFGMCFQNFFASGKIYKKKLATSRAKVMLVGLTDLKKEN
jgi:hypothetical protein